VSSVIACTWRRSSSGQPAGRLASVCDRNDVRRRLVSLDMARAKLSTYRAPTADQVIVRP
jgi:hypothetical protein